jgi:urease accessory protein
LLKLTRVLGNAAEPAVADQLHELEHEGLIEVVSIEPEDTSRRRMRVLTDHGAECAIMLSRDERLCHGAVLLLEPRRAVVVRVAKIAWLGLDPRDAAASLELGYLAGNLHWKVRFEGSRLWVELGGDLAAYRARLAHLLGDGRVEVADCQAPGQAAQ